MLSRFLFLRVAVVALLAASGEAQGQILPARPSLNTTYRYTAYTVYDSSSSDPPTAVSGVGGTLTLRPDSTYEKRLNIKGPNGLMYFRQDGRFTFRGDSIRFAFTDQKGPDVQHGTYRYQPGTGRLTVTILGYPAGNKGVYELVKAKPSPKTRKKPGKKRRV